MNGAGREGFDPSDQDRFLTTGRGAGKKGGDGVPHGLPEDSTSGHDRCNDHNDDGDGAARRTDSHEKIPADGADTTDPDAIGTDTAGAGVGAAGQVPLGLSLSGEGTTEDLVAGIQAAARGEAACRGRLLRLTADLYAAALARRGETVQARLGQASPWVAAAVAQATPDVVLRDVAAEIGVALMLPAGTARATVAEALIFATDLPLVLSALEQGRVSWSQARVILTHWRALMEHAPTARALARLNDEDREAVLAEARRIERKATSLIEDLLVRAPQVTTAQLGDYARRRRAALGAAGHQRACAAARRRRDVWVSPEDDGLAYLTALLDAPTAVAIAARVNRMATTLNDAPADTRHLNQHPVQGSTAPGLLEQGPSGHQPSGSNPDGSLTGTPLVQCRSIGEKRADVLADLLLDAELPESCGVPRGIRGQVSIMVPATNLIGHDPELAGPLAQAREAADAQTGGDDPASRAHRVSGAYRVAGRDSRGGQGEETTSRTGAKTPLVPPPVAGSSPPASTTEESSPSPSVVEAVERPPGAGLIPPVCPDPPGPETFDPAHAPAPEALDPAGDDPGAAMAHASAGGGRAAGDADPPVSGSEPGSPAATSDDSAPAAVLVGYGPIADLDALRIAAGASSWRRVLTDPHTGVVTDYGRHTYTVPAGLRALLTVRDETCRFPGCRRQSAGCDLDHTIAWENGGTTTASNLGFLCRHHHRIKHEARALGSWQVHHIDPVTGEPLDGSQTSGTGAGVLEWISPTGVVRRTAPGAATPVTTSWLTGQTPASGTAADHEDQPEGQAEDQAPPAIADDPAPF